MESGGKREGDMEIGYLWKKSLGESCSPPIQWRWNPGSWEPGSFNFVIFCPIFVPHLKPPKSCKKTHEFGRYNPTVVDIMDSESVTPWSVCWKPCKNIDAAKTRPLPPRPHLCMTSNIIQHPVPVCPVSCLCVLLVFYYNQSLGWEVLRLQHTSDLFASARATMKSSCPDSSHWKRLVPASCLLSHPCPSPTRRYSTPSLSNLWHLCHSCHLFLQHHKKLFQILTRHVKSSNTFTNFKNVSNLEKFPYQSDFKNQISSHL